MASKNILTVRELILTYREKARKLTKSMLKKWRSRIDEEEVISVSDLSLCEAACKFDASRGVSFITFLFYYIKGNLIKAIVTNSTINGISKEDYEENVGVADDMSTQDTLKELLNEEIAEASIGTSGATPMDHMLKKELYNLGKEACLKLDDIEKAVIERIYLKGEQLLDVAKELGYSRCHISRIKRKAISDIENSINKNFELKEDNKEFKEYIGKKIIRRKHDTEKVAI